MDNQRLRNLMSEGSTTGSTYHLIHPYVPNNASGPFENYPPLKVQINKSDYFNYLKSKSKFNLENAGDRIEIKNYRVIEKYIANYSDYWNLMVVPLSTKLISDDLLPSVPPRDDIDAFLLEMNRINYSILIYW